MMLVCEGSLCNWCWSVRVVYVLKKLPDVSGPSLEEVRRYIEASSLLHKMMCSAFGFS